MKILLVGYSYAPVLNPRAFRWTAITRHWVMAGHEVDVICGSVGGQPDEDVINGVNIHRTRWTGLAYVRDWFKKAGPSGPGAKLGHVSSPSTWKSMLLRRALNLWQFISWPDYACLWYPRARRRALELAARNNYDLLISSSLPFTGHLVGIAVRNKHPDLPWIVDIGDPFSFRDGEAIGNARLYRCFNRHVERRVLAAANAISVTTRGTASRYRQLFADLTSPIFVIPPLLSDVLAQPETHSETHAQDNPIRLVFVGTLYKTLRSPDNLLRLFARLQQQKLHAPVELHLYGNMESCAECFAPYVGFAGARLFLHGQVPRAIAIEAMRRATVLINIGNTSDYQLPSKVVEYVAMGKPIINMVSSMKDASRDFFSTFDGVLNLFQDEGSRDERCFAAVLDFVSLHIDIDVDARARQLTAYGIEQVAQDYLSLVQDLK